MRSRIAAQAARLMAEGGIDDFAHAKRKAARQLGAQSTQSLPNNSEIETELKAYRELYRGERHAAQILDLRRKALSAMRFFEKFDPYLTGSVLTGSAGANSAIHIQLFAANEKELQFFLLDREIPFDITDEPHFQRPRDDQVCVLRVVWQGTQLQLAIYDPIARRGALKAGAANGLTVDRAGIAAVERLVDTGSAHANS
jgi:hypothetical protein